MKTGSRPESSASVRRRASWSLFASRVGWSELGLLLVATHRLGDLEPFGEEVHERSVDVVDARPVLGQLRIVLVFAHHSEATGIRTVC